MNQNLELKLQSWVDGELSAPEARRISQEIASDAEASRLVAELQALKSALAGNETALAVPETREFYWSKIERQIQLEARSPRPAQAPRRAAWLHWLSSLAGVAGLACMLLLAFKPPGLPSYDEISATGEGMEAVTYHDQSAGMTVVWLADTEQQTAQPAIESPAVKTPDAGDPEAEME
jgi:anti-sigma-K factor RskA